jgi:hypothetical protein
MADLSKSESTGWSRRRTIVDLNRGASAASRTGAPSRTENSERDPLPQWNSVSGFSLGKVDLGVISPGGGGDVSRRSEVLLSCLRNMNGDFGSVRGTRFYGDPWS